jgi:hypothetical protein
MPFKLPSRLDAHLEASIVGCVYCAHASSGSLFVQVQRRYLKADLSCLHQPQPGFIMAFLAALLLVILEAVYGFMTVPHEYGHLWAARLVGHKVSVFQVCSAKGRPQRVIIYVMQ